MVFVRIWISLTNLVYETKIIKNLLSWTKLRGYFEYKQKNDLK